LKNKHILISNDDGVEAPGLSALASAISGAANVTVVAPNRNRSASSASLTLDVPIRCHQKTNGFYSVTGTPCDCVHLGSHRLMKNKPDMVIAGINRGANLGDDVLYSGTVAAAMEGRSLGFPAVAISLASRKCTHYQTAAAVMLTLLERYTNQPSATNIVLNINVPDLPEHAIKGFKLTRLGSRHRDDTIITSSDPKGEEIYWIGPPSKPQDIGEGTDFSAVADGYVSITPLLVDLTANQERKALAQWIKQF
jgi:5'/3'-nucleotidase